MTLTGSVTLIVALMISTVCVKTDALQTQECHQCAVASGQIEGRVVDSQGRPVGGITVYAIKPHFEKGVVPTVQTKRNGSFRLTAQPGEYTLFAGKESAGYPENFAVIYRDWVRGSETRVTANQLTTGIEIRLGPQLGTLVGRIKNASTGKSVSGANIRVSIGSDSASSFGTSVNKSGYFQILVPPVPFTLEVSAPGYKTKQVDALRIRLNTRKHLAISLIRLDSNPGLTLE